MSAIDSGADGTVDGLDLIGTTSTTSLEVHDPLIHRFGRWIGDMNPLHFDEEHARETIFGERVAHGALGLGAISAALSELPGTVVWTELDVSFHKPVYPGEEITAESEIVDRTKDGIPEYLTRVRVTVDDRSDACAISGTCTVLLDGVDDEPGGGEER